MGRTRLRTCALERNLYGHVCMRSRQSKHTFSTQSRVSVATVADECKKGFLGRRNVVRAFQEHVLYAPPKTPTISQAATRFDSILLLVLTLALVRTLLLMPTAREHAACSRVCAGRSFSFVLCGSTQQAWLLNADPAGATRAR